MKILAITEQRDGKWNKSSFETLAAAQQIAHDTGSTLVAAVIGNGVAALAEELAGKNVAEVLLIEHELLAAYTPDGFSLALAQVISQTSPDLVLLAAHVSSARFRTEARCISWQGHDRRLHRISLENGRLIFVRQMFQGKTAADVTFAGTGPWFATFQAGAFRADLAAANPNGKAPVKKITVELKPEQIRTKPAGNVPRSEASSGSDAGAHHRSRRTRHQSAGKYSAGGKTRESNRRRNRGIAADLRRRMAAHGAANRQLRPDSCTEALPRARHQRGDSARGRNERLAHDCRDQQRSKRAHF